MVIIKSGSNEANVSLHVDFNFFKKIRILSALFDGLKYVPLPSFTSCENVHTFDIDAP